ncbi:NYN domain-containing protein [Candidatus Magnetobacterium casense]|uniref:NYN domain-containing protein n=1 Tax=Candidatus Magnetobacterium casense TaxID=1455061 RepID=A0ABS6RTX2_9BACT|nr:NYN domain-containing protein [Candidatus Magnetobacterium casensis]MBV6340071.1 NYN domain-containing protein [Candidatus Magnetobacterium casensis]
MKKVFIFWDNSNIFISGKTVASEYEGQNAYYQLRLQFSTIVELAKAGREVEYAVAVGCVPPELRHVWNKMEQEGIAIELLERGAGSNKEQAVDQALQVHMLRKTIDYNGTPGIVVMLTGDGHGFHDGVGFHADLERMHKKGWGIEIMAWEKTCNSNLKKWAENIGTFIRLEDYYESITFLDDDKGVIRKSKPLSLDNRIRST